jgi:hypothetical protein
MARNLIITQAMKNSAPTFIFILLIFISGFLLSCKTDPKEKLVDDSFSAMVAYDAVALGTTLGLGGSTPEIEALLAEVKKTFGDIKPKTVVDEDKEFQGGTHLVKSPLLREIPTGEAERLSSDRPERKGL